MNLDSSDPLDNLDELLNDSTPLTVARAREMLGLLLLRVEVGRYEAARSFAALKHAVADLTAQVRQLGEQVSQLGEKSGDGERPEPRGCLKDIITVLRAADRRLTTMRILEEMAKAGYEWSESTVKYTLAGAVSSGLLINDPDSGPKGYGLPGDGDKGV